MNVKICTASFQYLPLLCPVVKKSSSYFTYISIPHIYIIKCKSEKIAFIFYDVKFHSYSFQYFPLSSSSVAVVKMSSSYFTHNPYHLFILSGVEISYPYFAMTNFMSLSFSIPSYFLFFARL